MTFAAVAGQRSDRATPSLRAAPQRQSMETTGRETIYRNRNAVQTNPATSTSPAAEAEAKRLIERNKRLSQQQKLWERADKDAA
jgi:hypothetical protein